MTCISVPIPSVVSGWSNKDWDHYLRSQGFELHRKSKHQLLYRIGDFTYGISSTPGDHRVNRNRIQQLRARLASSNLPYKAMAS